jgi:hypothetical protein
MMMPSSHDNLPPVLTQDEIVQPYEKLGRVQVTREVYLFDPYPASADAYAWGIQAIREEAAKMNADAVVLPEVTGHATMPVLPPSVLPVTEYHATGVAIRFK